MMTDPNSSILKKVTLGGGSRKVHVKEGESEILDNVESGPHEEKEIEHFSTTNNKLVEGSETDINSNLSKAENCKQLKDKIKTSEQSLKTLEAIKVKRKEGGGIKDAEIEDVLSSVHEDECVDEVYNFDKEKGVYGGGEGFAFANKSIPENKKEVRCIQAIFEVMVIDKTNSFGNILLSQGFRERYRIFLSDPYAIYAFLSVLGSCLALFGEADSLHSYYGVFSLFTLPSLIIVFMAMNVHLFKLLAFRFFTILKSVYILIFVISGIILSRERENSWGINIFFIMCGITIFFWGLFGDCFYLPWRVVAMQRSSIVTSILLFILIVLLHTGSLNVSDFKLEFMGHFNFSVLSLMASAVSTLFWLNLEIVYVAFMDSTRLVTLRSPIKSKKILKFFSQMIRSAAKTPNREASSLFPPAMTTLDDKIKYVKERLEAMNAKFIKLYADLTDEEKREIDNYLKEARKTEMLADQLKIFIHSSEIKEKVDVVVSTFPMQEIDSENTLGRWLFGTKTAKSIIKLEWVFQFMWLIGVLVTLLAMNKIISDFYALFVFFCLPGFSSFLLLNISILKQLLFQFETLVMAISSFIFCLCGAILLRERECNWSYFLFFAFFWVAGLGMIESDALPGSTRYLNVLLCSISGLTVYFTILFFVFIDKIEGQDFVIPMFGSLNITISNQCANAGFTCVIFILKNLIHAVMNPDQLVVLQGRLHFSKMMMSEVQVLQGINKVASQVNKSQRNIYTESVK